MFSLHKPPTPREQLSTVPPFTAGGTKFLCWVMEDRSYEWRSEDGRAAAGRVVGSHLCWAKADGALLQTSLPSLKAAMLAAVNGARLRNRKAG